MNQWIQALLNKAGEIALSYFHQVSPQLKANDTYVTEADLQIQAFLVKELSNQYPEYGFIGEENALQRSPQTGSCYWIIDPIDGTSAFVSGLPIWGISLTLMENGKAVNGYFHMPVTGEFFYNEGCNIFHNNRKTRLKEAMDFTKETVVLGLSQMHRYYDISGHFPGKIRCMGSTVAHMCYVAAGCADAALVSHVHLWDISTGMALILQNGGWAQYLDGSEIRLLDLRDGKVLPMPILAGEKETVLKLQKLIQLKK